MTPHPVPTANRGDSIARATPPCNNRPRRDPQVVVAGANEIAGLDPATGTLLWSHPHATRGAFNISTPLWSAADGLLFFSSAYDGGGRVLRLTAKGAEIEAEEPWFSNPVRVPFGPAIRIGAALVAVAAVPLVLAARFAFNPLNHTTRIRIARHESGAAASAFLHGGWGAKIEAAVATLPTVAGRAAQQHDRQDIVLREFLVG